MARTEVESELHDLFVRGQSGDAAAYHAFLRRLGAHLRAYLGRRLFGWPDEVEDLVQECLLAMHNQRHTYEPDQPLTAWVHAIARYKMIDLLRAKASREALHDPLDDDLQVLIARDLPFVLRVGFACVDDEELGARRVFVSELLQRGGAVAERGASP